MRRSLTILFDHQARTTFFPSEHSVSGTVDVLGHYPWEFVHPKQRKHVQTIFQRTLQTGKPSFHIAVLDPAHPAVDFLGPRCCVWLTPVSAPNACDTPCVALLAKCVMVPSIFGELSKRQLQVLEMIAEGLGPNHVAQQLKITRSAVDTHLLRIRKKLKLDALVQVAVWASTYRDILVPQIVGKIRKSLKN